MAFAIFYNRQDLTPIAAEYTRASLPQGDKQFALACWNAGLKNWDTAPVAPENIRCVQTPDGLRCDDDIRVVVISGSYQGSPITLLQFRQFLYRMSVNPGGEYLAALADDMGGSSGAQEPWPV